MSSQNGISQNPSEYPSHIFFRYKPTDMHRKKYKNRTPTTGTYPDMLMLPKLLPIRQAQSYINVEN